MIVVAGEALVDRIAWPDGRIVEVPGGAPFNTARTIGRLGEPVAFLGRLSTDTRGQRLREALAADGVELRWGVATTDPTTVAEASLDGAGAASYRFDLAGTSAPGLTLDDVAPAFASGLAAVFMGGLGLAVEPIAAALTAGLGSLDPTVLVMIDPNCRPAVIDDRAAYLDRLWTAIARADVVKVSVDDLAFMSPDRPIATASADLLALGPSLVLVTDGARPVRAVGPDLAIDVPVPAVEVVDTVGSGDAFDGGFLARFTALGGDRRALGDPALVGDVVEFGIRVATMTSQRLGADPPRRSEVGWS